MMFSELRRSVTLVEKESSSEPRLHRSRTLRSLNKWMFDNNRNSCISKGCARLPSTASLERELEGEVETNNKWILLAIVNFEFDDKNYEPYKWVTQRTVIVATMLVYKLLLSTNTNYFLLFRNFFCSIEIKKAALYSGLMFLSIIN